MQRIILWLASTIASLVLLFGYSTSTAGTASMVQAAPAIPGPQASATPTTPATPTPEPLTPAKKAVPSKTYTGKAVDTRYGPVQVEITTEGESVTDVKALQMPWSNGEDKAINGRAVPELNAQVVDGNPHTVHTVSGASYTSPAYIDSLQSALDQANL